MKPSHNFSCYQYHHAIAFLQIHLKNVLTRYFPVYPIWFLCFIIKSKLRRADEAEAVVVVPVVGVVVVPVRDGTV